MEPKILRICAFRRAEGKASPRSKGAKPCLKILIHAIANNPQADFRSLEQTESPLLRSPFFVENFGVLLVVAISVQETISLRGLFPPFLVSK